MDSKKRGLDCENLVSSYLSSRGYKIIARNFRSTFGEIDIIAQKENRLSFVEVKSFPASWIIEDISLKVNADKKKRIKMTASAFLETDNNFKYDTLGFDVAVVIGTEVIYYEGAF